MNESSDASMILATACPHCGTDCEFDLPAEAKTDADLASQIRIVCHSCDEMFQPIGDEIASFDDDPGYEAGDNQETDSDAHIPSEDMITDVAYTPPAPKRSSLGLIFLSLSILILAGAIAGAGYWLANSSNPAIKGFVETRVLEIEPARFEASRAQFERKQTEVGETLQILVEISNVGGQAATPKDVTLQLIDNFGNITFSWIMDTSKTVIEPGETANYLARMVAPPADIKDIRVLFPDTN